MGQPEFKVGDLVQLKSGSLPLTVTNAADDGKLECAWFDVCSLRYCFLDAACFIHAEHGANSRSVPPSDAVYYYAVTRPVPDSPESEATCAADLTGDVIPTPAPDEASWRDRRPSWMNGEGE